MGKNEKAALKLWAEVTVFLTILSFCLFFIPGLWWRFVECRFDAGMPFLFSVRLWSILNYFLWWVLAVDYFSVKTNRLRTVLFTVALCGLTLAMGDFAWALPNLLVWGILKPCADWRAMQPLPYNHSAGPDYHVFALLAFILVFVPVFRYPHAKKLFELRKYLAVYAAMFVFFFLLAAAAPGPEFSDMGYFVTKLADRRGSLMHLGLFLLNDIVGRGLNILAMAVAFKPARGFRHG